jgi:hypothetical protein
MKSVAILSLLNCGIVAKACSDFFMNFSSASIKLSGM